MEVRVLAVRKIDKGTLKAMVDIEIGDMIVRGLKIVQNGKGGPWVAWPSKEWTGRDGAVRYATIVEPVHAGLRKAVETAVLLAWQAQAQDPRQGRRRDAARPAFGYWDRRDIRQRVHLEWGAWLDGWPWEWFATLTFRDPVGTEHADDHWRKWVREIEDAVQESLGWVRCTEFQRWRKGVPHYHALVLGVGQMRRLSWMDRWNELAGFARILEYDPTNGARYYLGKYVTKGDGQIIVGPGLEHMCPGAPRPPRVPGVPAGIGLTVEAGKPTSGERAGQLRAHAQRPPRRDPQLLPVRPRPGAGPRDPVPPRAAPRPLLGHLTAEELAHLLAQIDRARPAGERDYLLVALLYDTGARVQELLDLTPRAFRFPTPACVRILGKGRRERPCPLLPQTARLVARFLANRGRTPDADRPLLANRRGEKLTRHGARYLLGKYLARGHATMPSLKRAGISPHTLRHYPGSRTIPGGARMGGPSARE